MKLKKLIFTTFTAVLLWSAAAHAEVTDTGTGSNAERNIKAIENYRTVLLNNTWNSKRVKADKFAVVDMNQDGVMEVFVECWDKDNEYAYAAFISAIMNYTEAGLNISNPGDELDNISIFSAVNPYDGRIVTERSRGKAIYTLYKFKGSGIDKCDSVFLPDLTESEKQTTYGNLFYLNYVDMTAENIDTYLSGNGKETGYCGILWHEELNNTIFSY